MNQDSIIAFLSNPASYGGGVATVERHETHGAFVFLAGDRAYKLKRAINYPYMDFSTPSLRRAACEAELAINRRGAPTLYQEVRAIVCDEKGEFRFGTAVEEASAVDWVVVMRRFEQSALLEEMRKRGELSPPLMKGLADAIAEYHRGAEISLRFGGAGGILRVIDENVEMLGRWKGRPFADNVIEQYSSLSRKAHQDLSGMLEERRRNGFVRRCHGDLHLNNICMIGGKPVLFDAIEFSEDFACIDVFYDLAFLLMDLEHRKLRSLANVLLNRYVEDTEDFEGIAALPLFLSCRAALRAHVTAALADKTRTESVSKLFDDAVALLNDAVDLLKKEPPQLIVLGGLSGTGKSTIARNIAPNLGRTPGAIVLRSDVIRKKICGVAETDRLPQEGYSTEINTRVYAIIAERAEQILKGGHSIVADAVYGHASERRQIEAAARSASATCHAVWLDAPKDILERRILARHGDASDATVEVLHKQLTAVVVPGDWPKVDVSGTPEQAVLRLHGALGN